MAIPTVFGSGGSPVAGTTKSFKIPGTTFYALDDAGTSTPVMVPLLGNATVVCQATVTEADLVAAMKSYVERAGSGADRGCAQNYPVRASLQAAATLTTCT